MKTNLFYKNVTVLDYAYWDSVRGLVGNSLNVDVEFVGSLDGEGILFDFSYAKKAVKEVIDLEVDHRFLIPSSKINHQIFKEKTADGSYEYAAPSEAFCLIESDVVNDESLKAHLEMIILKKMPENISKVLITLRKECDPDHEGYFHYTHGLKSHYGNCQRLVHGHRNSVKVFSEGKREREIEKNIMTDWFKLNIHFVFSENIISSDAHTVTLGYRSKQGDFKLTLPFSQVYIIEKESTVENLSQVFLERVLKEYPELCHVEVHAFEGIAKGARSLQK